MGKKKHYPVIKKKEKKNLVTLILLKSTESASPGTESKSLDFFNDADE